MTRNALLQGIRIADLTSVFFGPYATQTLADLGAEVIKIEPPEGDTSRLVGTPPVTPGMGPVYMRLNRGKRSVVWDLKSPQGKEAMHRLIASSDVFIHNIRTDAIDRVGLGYDAVRAIRPDIVYVHCTGFDERGPYAGLQAYDDIIQAATGSASLLSKVDGNPQPRYMPMAMADKVSGLHAVYATLAAVIHRLRTGEGQKVEVPMFESMASFNMLEHLCDKTFVPPTGPALYPRQIDPTRQPMKTRDGYISFAPYLDERWVRFFNAAGHPEVLLEERFIDKPTRRKNMSQMFEVMAEIAVERTTDEWLALCKDAHVPAMRVNQIDDLLDDPQLSASGLLRRRVHPTEGGYVEVGLPVQFSAYEYGELSHPASLGEHSDAVARELGVDLGPASRAD
jgi:crotonobetainyl-CoA:carnitine CoA-transferase CaiB-like acyl-CoA transferase